MPEVLLLCEYATINGGEQSMLATLDGVRAMGFCPVVMAPAAGPLSDALRHRDVEVVPFQTRGADGKPLPQNRLRQQLAQQLYRRPPGLLHANSLSMGRLSGPVAAELALPSLAHLRDIVNLSAQAVADLNCHRRLLAVSEATRVFHTARGLDEGKTYVLYNGVDLQRYRPRPKTGYLHQELKLPAQTRLIGTIGQISLRKGQDVLAQAAVFSAEKAPDVHYLVAGQRYSEKAESRQFEAALRGAAEGPLAGRLHLLGYRGDVERILNELMLLVHPARQEPLGRVLLESAASGVAVVATDVGGTGEIFPPGLEAACLVPPDDPRALANAILRLAADEALRQRLAAAARKRAEETFDIRRASAALVQHYREVLRQ